jgi:septum formation inhibitor MinC
MSSATSSAFVLFSDKDIMELQDQQLDLTERASLLATAVKEAEEHLQKLKQKYAVSQECLQHLSSLITVALAERAAVIKKSSDDKAAANFEKALAMVEAEDEAKEEAEEETEEEEADEADFTITSPAKISDNLEISEIAPGDGKSDAPTIIRALLKTHFSNNVDMDTFHNEESVRCSVNLKNVPTVLLIWYNASIRPGKLNLVRCGTKYYNFTTVGELRVAITDLIAMAPLSCEKYWNEISEDESEYEDD